MILREMGGGHVETINVLLFMIDDVNKKYVMSAFSRIPCFFVFFSFLVFVFLFLLNLTF